EGHSRPGQVEGPFAEARVTAPVNHGWAVFLLPFLEQEALARRYRWDLHFNDALNQPVATTHLKILQCPSAEPNRVQLFLTTDRLGTCTDYAPTRHLSAALVNSGLIDLVGNYQGVMTRNKMVRLREITDGTAQTLVVTECAGRPQRWQAGRLVPGETSPGCPWVTSMNRLLIDGSSLDGAETPGPCAINCTNEGEVYSF